MRWVLRIVIGLVVLVVLFVATGLVYHPDPSPLRLPRSTAVVDGTQLSYHQRGSGPDVVLIHGGMGSAEDWEPVLAQLAESFRVTVVDRPGFGLSRADGKLDATYPGNAKLIAGLVTQLGLERPILVGHSRGGGISMLIAEDFPDMPRALVLLAPAAYPPDHEPSFVDKLGAVPVFGNGLFAALGPLVGPRTIAGVLEPMIAPDRKVLPPYFVSYRQELWTNPLSLAVNSRQQVANIGGLMHLAARRGEIRVPVTIVGCSLDSTEGQMVDSRRLAKEMTGSQLRWLEGCGHYVQYAHPEVVVEAVRAAASKT